MAYSKIENINLGWVELGFPDGETDGDTFLKI